LTAASPQYSFYTIPSRLWELMAGVMLCELHVSSGQAVSQSLGVPGDLVGGAAAALIGYSLLRTRDDQGFPCPGALPAVLGTLAFIDSGTSRLSFTSWCFSFPALVYVGKLSYPIYLWHWPLLVLRRHLAQESVASTALCVVLVFLLAAISHEVLEGQVRRWRPRSKIQWEVFAVMLPLVLGCLSWLWLLNAEGLMIFGTTESALGCGRVSPANEAVLLSPPPSQRKLVDNHCGCSYLEPTFHVPQFAQTGEGASSLTACYRYAPPPLSGHHDEPGSPFVGPCTVAGRSARWRKDRAVLARQADECLQPDRGADNDAKALWLAGDSHSSHLVPALEMASIGYSLRSFRTTAPCSSYYQRRYPECDAYVDMVTKSVLKYARPGDIFVLAGRRRSSPNDLEDYKVFVESFAKDLAHAGASLLLLGDATAFGPPGTSCIPTCFTSGARDDCEKPFATAKHEQRIFTNISRGLAAQLPGVYFFDFMPLLCSDKTCSVFIPGTNTLLNWDGGHLTIAGSKYLWPWFCSVLRNISLDGAPFEPVAVVNT